MTYPSGRIITYAPGGAGRPLSVIESAHSINYVTNATYAPPGELYQFSNGSSLAGAMTYNSRLQPLQLYFTTGTISSGTLTQLQQAPCPTTAATVMSRSYNLGAGTNDNGNVQSIADCLNTDRTQNFDYDNLNRLADAYTTGTGTTQTNWGEVYTIDPWGNLTNIALKTGWHNSEMLNAAPASAQNQLNGFCNDAAGNMTGAPPCSTYAYDAENRLIAAAGMSYLYDGNGKRVEKCTQGTTPGTCAANATGTLYWTGTGSDALAETDWTGAAVEEYVFFNGKRIARRDGTGNTVHYYFADHLGSTSIITSAAGAIQKASVYYPYGEEIAVTGPSFANNYKFTGKERDTESGLDNFTARYVSSAIGRFMSPDPFGGHREDPQTLNRYAYVRNNPITLTDPTGLDFYLRCNKNNGKTCQRGHQYYIDKDGHYQETVVKSDKNGNLTDQSGNKYSGTFDGKNVNFTRDGSNQASTGEWKQNSNETSGIRGTGNFDRFDFTFYNHNSVQTLYAKFDFYGTQEQAEAALKKAGFVHFALGFHFGQTEYRQNVEGRNSFHFSITGAVLSPETNLPVAYGDMHNNEYYADPIHGHLLDHFWYDVLKMP